MIRVNNNDSLSSLFEDVHRVVCEASREFNRVEYRFDFSSSAVRRVCFTFAFRKSYYVNVYPLKVELFSYLDMMKRVSPTSFAFVRHSVGVFRDENNVKKYSLVLWY